MDSSKKKKKGGGKVRVLVTWLHKELTWLSHDQRVVEEDEDEPPDLLAKPREYKVKFSFPNPPPLNPPILGAYGELHLILLDRKFYKI